MGGTNVWDAARFKITSEIKQKLQTGAVIEIVYECDNTLDWVPDNKAMWFDGEIGLNNAKEQVKWNESGTIVQVAYDTLNNNLESGWDSEGAFINYYAGGPCVIKSIKIGMLDMTEGEDRSNLYTLTETIELTEFESTIDTQFGTAGVTFIPGVAEKLREGAVIEIAYECSVPEGSEWMGNKTCKQNNRK